MRRLFQSSAAPRGLATEHPMTYEFANFLAGEGWLCGEIGKAEAAPALDDALRKVKLKFLRGPAAPALS